MICFKLNGKIQCRQNSERKRERKNDNSNIKSNNKNERKANAVSQWLNIK